MAARAVHVDEVNPEKSEPLGSDAWEIKKLQPLIFKGCAVVVAVGLEPTSVRSIVVQTPWSGVCTRFALTNSRRFLLRRTAHRADASLVCPIDVNDVL